MRWTFEDHFPQHCEASALRQPQQKLAFHFCYHPPTVWGSRWRFVRYKLYSRWYAVIRPFESPSVSLFFTLSLSPACLSFFLLPSLKLVSTQVLQCFSITSFHMAHCLTGNFWEDIAQAFRFVIAVSSIVAPNRWITCWPNRMLALSYGK